MLMVGMVVWGVVGRVAVVVPAAAAAPAAGKPRK